MYVYTHIYIYTYIYIYIYICISLSLSIYLSISLSLYIYIYIYIHIHTCQTHISFSSYFSQFLFVCNIYITMLLIIQFFFGRAPRRSAAARRRAARSAPRAVRGPHIHKYFIQTIYHILLRNVLLNLFVYNARLSGPSLTLPICVHQDLALYIEEQFEDQRDARAFYTRTLLYRFYTICSIQSIYHILLYNIPILFIMQCSVIRLLE